MLVIPVFLNVYFESFVVKPNNSFFLVNSYKFRQVLCVCLWYDTSNAVLYAVLYRFRFALLFSYTTRILFQTNLIKETVLFILFLRVSIQNIGSPWYGF